MVELCSKTIRVWRSFSEAFCEFHFPGVPKAARMTCCTLGESSSFVAVVMARPSCQACVYTVPLVARVLLGVCRVCDGRCLCAGQCLVCSGSLLEVLPCWFRDPALSFTGFLSSSIFNCIDFCSHLYYFLTSDLFAVFFSPFSSSLDDQLETSPLSEFTVNGPLRTVSTAHILGYVVLSFSFTSTFF